MQVPEKLSLIGGSILLSSTLVFTLKSQASTILPHVSHSISHVFDHIGDAQKSSDFDNKFSQAQNQGWQTGRWGSSKYYIDKDMNMHVGAGTLQGGLAYLLGEDKADDIKTLSIDQNIQAPQDSGTLFSTSYLWNSSSHSSLTDIYGLDRVDTSQVTNMTSLFCNDYQLRNLDGINSWNVSNVQGSAFAFMGNAMHDINISGWDLSHTQDTGVMFTANPSLQSVDLSHVDTSNATTKAMFGGDYEAGSENWSNPDKDLHQVTLGPKTQLKEISYFPDGTWQNGSQRLSSAQLVDGNSHPGTWTKQ